MCQTLKAQHCIAEAFQTPPRFTSRCIAEAFRPTPLVAPQGLQVDPGREGSQRVVVMLYPGLPHCHHSHAVLVLLS